MKKNIPELDKLFLQIGTYRRSKELRELFEFVKKFPEIAPYNAMLLHVQKPGSQYVATTTEWKKKFNRTIKAGARPLVILRPFGPVSFVFELGDTEGKDNIPKKLIDPFAVKGEITLGKFNRLIENIKSDGISYNEVEYGTGHAGSIRTNSIDKEQKVVRGKKEIWVNTLYEIVTNSNHSLETKFTTIIHELGHLYCGHLGSPDEKWWKRRTNLSKNQVEFEAESVCWLVCERMGINNPSAQYLSGYLNKNEEIPNVSIDTVLKSVATIESMINGSKKPRKEIITRTVDLKK